MPQQCADYRRLSAAQRAQLTAPGYETMARASAGMPDAGMLARHEHRTRQAVASDTGALALRRRQLDLLKLAAG
jgi:hypothetical protein